MRNSLAKIVLAGSLISLSPIKSECQNFDFEGKERERFGEIKEFVESEGFNSDYLMSPKRFSIYNHIEETFEGSPESTNPSLDEYKEILGFEDKKEKIVPFTKKYEEELRSAESKYGIDKEIISATLGVESEFGSVTGNYNPFEAYVSMYVDGYRKEFAKRQLEALLEFSERKNLDVLDLKSSYAGAMGYGQLIPSSVNAYFVGDDLYDMEDNINSVANYYAKNREETLYETILNYNPDSNYANSVIDLAKYAEENFKE
ncbi:MAG: lytic murein transglycosylase [Candidatus Pacearchaeota archaeon]